MIKIKNNVMLHLPKTGGTFVNQCFMKNSLHSEISARSHSSLYDINFDSRQQRAFIIIRNPLDYYVSWYHYSKPRRTSWWSVHSNNTDKTFKNVLKNLLFAAERKDMYSKKYSTPNAWREEREVFREMNEMNCSWYGYRIRQITSTTSHKLENNLGKEWLKIYDFSDFDNSLREIFTRFGITDAIIPSQKIQTSQHGPFLEYYDEESLGWVLEKDKWIFECLKRIKTTSIK